MNLIEIVTLFVAMTVLALVPSTSVALVIARSSAAGFLNGCAVAAGIVVGDLVFVLLAMLGVAALAEVMGSFFVLVKCLAGAYLIWFGISLMKSRASLQRVGSVRPASTLAASFFSGLFLTLGDVKAILFYASFFPAFVDPAGATASDIAIIVASTIVTVGGVKLGYAYAAGKLVSLVQGTKTLSAVNASAGGVMVAAGVYLIVKA